jgi:glutamine---fructose-6-phosphate transaminase (isomerizing)
VTEGDLVHAEITTRDIDRGDNPHFLLKEITEAPQSFRKTLRGSIRDDGGLLHVVLGEHAAVPTITDRLASGAIRRVLVIGQGTAAVAGQSCAEALADAGADGSRLRVEPRRPRSSAGSACRRTCPTR